LDVQKEAKDLRIPMVMEPSLLRKIEDYQFGKRLSSRSEAIRQLIRSGLEKEMPAAAGS